MTVELRVNRVVYEGWKTAHVTRSMETVANGFELEVSERWANQSKPWPIKEEDECKLLLDGTPVITGYVDTRTISRTAEDHTLSVSGRDRTGDLVDCSVYLSKWEFRNLNVRQFAALICQAFQITVTNQTGLSIDPIKRLSVDQGDTAFEAIEKACRIAGVLCVADGNGGLLLTRAGVNRCKTALVEGENLLSLSGTFDATGRFRTYIVLGQHASTSEFFGKPAARVKATCTDEAVSRHWRSLVVRPEGNVTPAQAKTRGEWEAKVRAARAETITVTVQGWSQAGALWPINALVPVRSPSLGVNGDLLIVQAVHTLDSNAGSVTELTLKRPDAFKPEPVLKPAKGLSEWPEIK